MNKLQVASWIMIIVVFALSVYSFFWIKGESFQCVSNPYTYSINLLEKANNGEVTAIFTSYPKDRMGTSVLLTNKGFFPIVTGKASGNYNDSFNFNITVIQ